MRKLICTAAAAFAFAAPALAGDKPPVFVETMAVPDKPGFAIDPAKGYVLMRGDTQTAMYLMRVPSEADAVAYAAYRARELAKAREKYARKLKQYEEQMAAPAQPGVARPVRPVEPTEENFQAIPFEVLTAISIGPLFRFAKVKGGESTYLQMLTPGEYRLYGPIVVTPSGPMGACYCMGSVKFEVRAGEITDIGALLTKGVAFQRPPEGDSSMPMLGDPNVFLRPAPPGMALDPRLASLPIRQAEFHPVGKLPNYYGIQVARIPAIPGVIAYDRDRIIDLTASGAAK